jgi:hypothetical protein
LATKGILLCPNGWEALWQLQDSRGGSLCLRLLAKALLPQSGEAKNMGRPGRGGTVVLGEKQSLTLKPSAALKLAANPRRSQAHEIWRLKTLKKHFKCPVTEKFTLKLAANPRRSQARVNSEGAKPKQKEKTL